MHAVIMSGGKQYYVAPGQTLKIEKLEGEVGNKIEFKEVLLVADGDTIHSGTPLLSGATVFGEVVDQARHKKIRIIKFRRRKHHMKRMGHRQHYTEVKITDITAK